ncbi:ABC transporter permease [Cellulosilyticum sp. I15G10I2]|uniref:ABC transporter permease n=1 Tax=Cellulosilyticum sp. I15G10I2 TaxID=1892843 RepID=UPI00085BD78D|nr:ABC transporter permease [Cellulosilyticum sp. I15G10I2]
MENKRIIENKKQFNLKQFFFQWEWMLVAVFIIINIMNTNLSPYYLSFDGIMGATMTFLDKAFMVLPMVFIIILGDIDISIASTTALVSVIMGVAYNMGVPMPLAILLALAIGAVCGFINGILIVKFRELPAMIVTLSTMTIYRGIAYIILEDQAAGKFPEWYAYLGWGYVGKIPFMLIAFIIFAVLFALLLHKTTFGRSVYGMGNNETACRYSGIKTDKIKVIVFTLMGLMASVTALFLVSRTGSARPNIALGYELDVIAMVVLGGISTLGGKGRMLGAIISVFIIGLLRYGLGLINVPAQALMIIIGVILIIAVTIPNINLESITKKKATV